MICRILYQILVLYVVIEKPMVFSNRPVLCRDPDAGGTQSRNKDRKFMIIGSHESYESSGLGNMLIFFPAAYYFAAFTGRDIIISDKSIVGEICSIIVCGFPFVRELSYAFPEILTESNIKHATVVKAVDFGNYMNNKKEIDSPVVRAGGYMPASEWWMYYNTTAECVKKITGCDIGDVACADRHAFQRLIRGPFKSALSEKEEKRVLGVPQHIKHAVLTLPHAYAPRLDAAIHIRAQFHHFEKNADVKDPEYQREVQTWLNSSEAASVFSALETKLIAVIKEGQNDVLKSKLKAVTGVDTGIVPVALNVSVPNDHIYVYLASDNEEVKDRFTTILEQSTAGDFKFQVMRVEAQFIHHVKDLAKMKNATNNEGLLDLVFDWYALSLSNVILAWRKGSTNMVSTFVHSAQRVSGTTERTDAYAPPGHGIGSKGYQLLKDRRGNPKWDAMWTYSFLDEYKINIARRSRNRRRRRTT